MSRRSDLSRRQFLVRSAGIAGASLGVGKGGAATPQCVRVGLIGAGDRGRQLLGAVLGASGPEVGARVVAVCDLDPRNLKRAMELVESASPDGRRPRGYTAFRPVLDDAEVDAVIVATPSHLHAQQVVGALTAGKHVYGEKPLGLSVEECDLVARAAKDAQVRGLVYQVGLQRRYNPRYREAVGFLQSGEGGEVRFLRAQWHAVGVNRKSKPWLRRRDRSGGMVVEQAIHQLDLFNWLLGAAPVRVAALGDLSESLESPGADRYGAILEYPTGVQVHFSHLLDSVSDRRFGGIYELVFTDRGGIDLTNARFLSHDGSARDLASSGGNETRSAMESFFRDIVVGGIPAAGAAEGRRATLTALLCRSAIENRRVVTWSEIES